MAVTVKFVELSVAFGVPEITQVVELIDAHAGRGGEVVQLVIAAPLALRVVGMTDMGVPKFPLVPADPE